MNVPEDIPMVEKELDGMEKRKRRLLRENPSVSTEDISEKIPCANDAVDVETIEIPGGRTPKATLEGSPKMVWVLRVLLPPRVSRARALQVVALVSRRWRERCSKCKTWMQN